jgi:hypothetical protein
MESNLTSHSPYSSFTIIFISISNQFLKSLFPSYTLHCQQKQAGFPGDYPLHTAIMKRPNRLIGFCSQTLRRFVVCLFLVIELNSYLIVYMIDKKYRIIEVVGNHLSEHERKHGFVTEQIGLIVKSKDVQLVYPIPTTSSTSTASGTVIGGHGPINSIGETNYSSPSMSTSVSSSNLGGFTARQQTMDNHNIIIGMIESIYIYY